MHRRRLLGLLTTSLLLAPTAALALDGSATALHVEGVLTVSESEEGEATALEVLGEEVASTEGDGESHVASTSDAGVPEEVAEVTVLRSSVEGEESSADAVVVAVGGDEGVEVKALSSSRDASSARTSGVSVSGGGRTLEVGSTRVDSGGGSSAVIDTGDQRIVTDEDTDGALCGAELPQVLRAEVLCVESVDGRDDAALVRDLEATPGGTDLGMPSLEFLRANGFTGQTIPPATPPPTAPPPVVPAPPVTPPTTPPVTPAPPVTTAGVPDAPLAAPLPAPDLPVAGAPVLALVAAALGSIGAGAGLLRRRTDG